MAPVISTTGPVSNLLVGVCYEFRRKGSCFKENCRFQHSNAVEVIPSVDKDFPVPVGKESPISAVKGLPVPVVNESISVDKAAFEKLVMQVNELHLNQNELLLNQAKKDSEMKEVKEELAAIKETFALDDIRLKVFRLVTGSFSSLPTVKNAKQTLKLRYYSRVGRDKSGDIMKYRCCVCGTAEGPGVDITAAHIAPGNEDPKNKKYYSCFGRSNGYVDEVNPKSERNYLILCGTHGSKRPTARGPVDSCHSLFDNFDLIVLQNPVSKEYRYWCGKEDHPLYNLSNEAGGRVYIVSNHKPYQRLLVWRTKHCLRTNSSFKPTMFKELKTWEDLSLDIVKGPGAKKFPGGGKK
jgi:hypothetical protein